MMKLKIIKLKKKKSGKKVRNQKNTDRIRNNNS